MYLVLRILIVATLLCRLKSFVYCNHTHFIGIVPREAEATAMLLGVYTFRSSNRLVGPTQATSDCLSDQSDRPVGQTVAEPPSSVNHINAVC